MLKKRALIQTDWLKMYSKLCIDFYAKENLISSAVRISQFVFLVDVTLKTYLVEWIKYIYCN